MKRAGMCEEGRRGREEVMIPRGFSELVWTDAAMSFISLSTAVASLPKRPRARASAAVAASRGCPASSMKRGDSISHSCRWRCTSLQQKSGC